MAKIIKNITPILNKIQKFKNNDFSINYRNGWNGALIGIRKLLQLNYSGGSNYANYETPRGILSLRLSGHNANGNNFNAEHTNISVFVALFEYPHIPSDSDYKEFKISQEKYNSNPLKVVQEIIAATEKALLGGVFIMDKNIAEEKQYTRETKKLQADVADTNAVHGESNLVTHPQGEVAKVLQNYVNANKNKGNISSDILLNGEPIVELSGEEFLPIERKTFVQQVEEFFQKQGGVARSAFGDVILDKKGIRNDFHHGMSPIKRASFAAVKDVLECGIIILQLDYYHTNNKKQMTGMIAAPIKISEERYVCVVEVIANTNKRRLYLHEAFLIKNLQEIVATSPVHDNNIITSRQPQGENLFEDAASNSVQGSETTSPHPQGEIAKVLQNYVCANKNILNEKIRLYDQENGTELARFVAFLERGKVYEENESKFFHIGKTGELLQKYGMKGDITIGRSAFNERHSKDGHDLSIEDWTSIARNINHPIAISKYTKRKMSYRIYVSARINGIAACVGTDVHSLGKNIEVTNISTVFWRDMGKAGQGEFEKLLYPET